MIHPLDGVRILDATQAWAGPLATMMLADLGAEVIKIEPPGTGDHVRGWAPAACQGQSPHFLCVNRNKKSVTLNLKSPEGKELFLRLAEKSDVVVENFRPGVMKKLGVDYETIKKRNERVIYCSVSGFGQDGPFSQLPAYDIIIQAIGGVMSFTGERGGRPLKLGAPQGDVLGALVAGFSILGALFYREKTGQGSCLDIAMLDAQITLVGFNIVNYLLSGNIPKPMGNAHPLLAPYESFQTSTHEIIIGVGTEKQWKKFCEVTNLAHLADDPRFNSAGKRVDHRGELIPLIQEVISRQPADYWLKVLFENQVPCAPVNDVKSLTTDPQVLHREMLIEMEYPDLGKILLPGVPWKVPGVRDQHTPPPTLGQHTSSVLAGLLGITGEELEHYRKEGVI